MSTTTLNLTPVITLRRKQFYDLCAANPDARLELNAEGELIVMPPTGGETSARNSDINLDLGLWNRQSKLGKVFDSSGGFSLPNGAERSPDAAWIPIAKWNRLTPEERRGFLPLCPDFVIELLSPSDSWHRTMSKMEEYQKNGCRLGWLLDPKKKRVAIYREGQSVEILDRPMSLSGEAVLPGFRLNLEDFWG